MKEVFVPTFSVKFCESHQSPAPVQSRQEQTCFDLLKAVVAMGGVIAKVKLTCGCRLTYFGSHDSTPEPRRSVSLDRRKVPPRKPQPCTCYQYKGVCPEHGWWLPGMGPRPRYEE